MEVRDYRKANSIGKRLDEILKSLQEDEVPVLAAAMAKSERQDPDRLNNHLLDRWEKLVESSSDDASQGGTKNKAARLPAPKFRRPRPAIDLSPNVLVEHCMEA